MLLIIEPNCEGHHIHYARWMVGEAISCGYDVVFATSPYCMEHHLYEDLREECGERVQSLDIPLEGKKTEPRNVADMIWQDYRYYRAFADCYRQLSRYRSPDYVFLPYDYCLYSASVLGSPFGGTPWGGMILRPTFHLQEMGVSAPKSRLRQAKTMLLLRLLRKDRSLRALYTFDETLIRYFRQRDPESGRRLLSLPEPVELDGSHSRESARRTLGISQEDYVILVYGVLDSSKGIGALLAASAEHEFPESAALLLAGSQKDEIKDLLAGDQAKRLRKDERLYEQDRFLYGEDEYAMFEAADVVWVGYEGQYVSSGVLLQAAMAGLPVVACDEGLIGWLTKSRKLGIVVNTADTRAVARALSTLAQNPELAAEFGENGRRFSVRHGVDNFRRKLRERVFSQPLPGPPL